MNAIIQMEIIRIIAHGYEMHKTHSVSRSKKCFSSRLDEEFILSLFYNPKNNYSRDLFRRNNNNK
jgi:hypothetical protein